ncbi:MAG: putative metal-binding motif-containing protein [Polyangiales bacterium]
MASDCDDGVFCNGVEVCGAMGCEAGEPPCTGGTCVEASGICQSTCVDADFDGHRDVACGGDDCDDADPNRFPSNVEVCDVANHDEDCDPRTFGFRDQDMDNYPDVACCNGDVCGTDCNDLNPSVHPDEAESCDGRDNDCDELIDEEVLRTFYPDLDHDLAGDMNATPITACTPPPDSVENALDCDDSTADVGPLRSEICDPGCMPDGTGCVDENCDGVVQTECSCTGSETRGCPALGVCAGGIETCNALTGVWGTCSVTPSMEVCNGSDDNCNGMVDEGLGGRTCWLDSDHDGFALAGAPEIETCAACPPGYTDQQPVGGMIDCNDLVGDGEDFYPGAPELCDRRDNNCSSGGGVVVAEDADDDGHTRMGFTGCSGGPLPKDDCHDGAEDVHPGQTAYYDYTFCPESMPSCAPSERIADFDCNGVTEPQPAGAGCVNPGAMCTTTCAEDLGPRPFDAKAANCGMEVVFYSCRCLGTTGCTVQGSIFDTLLCR